MVSLIPFSDETRTSYLLQGVQSAWDSTGRRRPQSQAQPKTSAAAQGAVGGAWGGGESPPPGVREAGEGGESVRGAEAALDMPYKGNNVSPPVTVILTLTSLDCSYT